MSVHQEAAHDHSGEGDLTPHICTVQGVEEDSGDDPDGALVG